MKADKRLAQMRNNPRGDWTIDDIRAVCEADGILVEAPRRGSHFTLSATGAPAAKLGMAGRLTIPARRPIKPVYVER